MIEESSDRLGRWFARYDDAGVERFSARLLNGTDELGIAWTDDVARLAGDIAKVQTAIGRSIPKITGMASDGIEAAIKAGRFNANLYAKHLARRLGGAVANRRGEAGGRGRLGDYSYEDRQLSTVSHEYQYWPFAMSDVDVADPETAEKVAFLKAAAETGAESYKFGINNYGARAEHRAGIILERGRRLWEVRLSGHDIRRFLAFTGSFSRAGAAVNSWLAGCTIEQILGNLRDHLVVPPGLQESYKIHEADEE